MRKIVSRVKWVKLNQNTFKFPLTTQLVQKFHTTRYNLEKQDDETLPEDKVIKEQDSVVPVEPYGGSLGRNDHRTPTIVKIICTKSVLIPRIITDDKAILKSVELKGQKAGKMFGAFLVKEQYRNHENITSIDQLEEIGTLAILFDNNEGPKSVYGIRKIRLVKQVKGDETLSAYIEEVKPTPIDPNDLGLKAQILELYSMMRQFEKEVQARYIFKNVLDTFSPRDDDDVEVTMAMIERDPYVLYDIISTVDIYEKLHKCLNVVRRHLEGGRINNQIKKAVDEKAQQAQHNFILNETYKVIKKELGLEVDDRQALIAKFEKRIKDLVLTETARTTIQEEIAKLKTLEPSSAEFNVSRNYLDWLTILPWGKFRKEVFDIKSAIKILDQDHYGLTKCKDRILEFIAVGKLKGTVQGKIILFVGPPGVGKTSIGKSIARALDREFFRFSLGGMTDVAEIKGHRRTYIGAMPGKLLQLLKLSKSQNPVIMMDEIDKLGRGHGDPASALLELLDPEQNNSFLDHYLDVPFDMSKILFICTANSIDTIPKPLLDRMEVMRLSGYIEEEKLHIAKNYLIPKIIKETGLKSNQFKLSDHVILKIIKEYCREAGVRNLEKRIESVARKVALSIAKNSPIKHIHDHELVQLLGLPAHSTDKYFDVNPIGVVTGLAWTEMGGSIIYIETLLNPTESGFIVTGKLGEVMKESTSIAMTVAKNLLKKLDPENNFFKEKGVHMHVPEGATPKDGPSAGIAMVTSLLSLAMGKPVKDIAMTGEITLTEKVLEIGGVKEKVIAAKRVGIKEIILPKDNLKSWQELEKEITKDIKVHFVDYYKEVFDLIF